MLPEEYCLRKVSGDKVDVAPHNTPTAFFERITKATCLIDGRVVISKVAGWLESHKSFNIRGDFFRICTPFLSHPCQQFLARLLQSGLNFVDFLRACSQDIHRHINPITHAPPPAASRAGKTWKLPSVRTRKDERSRSRSLQLLPPETSPMQQNRAHKTPWPWRHRGTERARQ